MDRKCETMPSMRILLVLTLAAGLLLVSFGYSVEYAASLFSDEGNTKSEKSDWHQWRGPNRDGISYEKGIPKDWQENEPEILWQVTPISLENEPSRWLSYLITNP